MTDDAATPSRENTATTERGADWPVALALFSTVVALYAAIAYLIFELI